MPAEPMVNIFDFESLFTFVRLATLILLVFYAIFALIIIRQVNLMIETLYTPLAPVVRFVSIVHAGFAIGLIFLVFGIL
jgi:hypothetical protein